MLSRSFFLHPTIEVARSLLGTKMLTWTWDKSLKRRREVSGMIVEVEAYHQDGDLASHSWRGRTKRNQAMFMQGGLCYVYLIYGMYHCVNIVTESEGIGAAVLVRALEPLKGIDIMQRRRKTKNLHNLTSGPGKICQALAIKTNFSEEDFITSKHIQLRPLRKIPSSKIVQSKRIGISRSQNLPWRFSVKDNPWVSAGR